MTTTTSAALFRWHDLPQDTPMAKLARRRIIGENAMISEITLHEGCHVPTHSHENEQFACVMSGKLRFGIGAEDSPERHDVTVTAGEVLFLPANLPHSADALEESVVLDIFSPPSGETGIDAHSG